MSHVSRRAFLGLAGAAAGAALFRVPLLRAADSANSKYGGYAMGIQSFTLRHYNTDEAIKITEELGLTRIEFFGAHYSPGSSDQQIAAMTKKLTEAGLKPSAHGVDGFSKDHETNRKLFEFAKKAGIPIITADPSEDAFDSLDKLVAEFDIRIAIHNHGPGARYNKIDDVLKAVKGHDKRVGACADLGHYIRSGEDPVKAITLLGDRLHGVHLKDFAESNGNYTGVILGKGQMNVVEVFKALKRVNFAPTAALSLEYEEHEKDPIADVKECLAVASEAAQKALG